MIVVADTGPINYLILVGEIPLLHSLYGEVAVPRAVMTELSSPAAPDAVRTWVRETHVWLSVVDLPADSEADLPDSLDAGETAAIALAISIGADILVMDDRAGERKQCGEAWPSRARWAWYGLQPREG